jgi:hypothetical protein
MKKTIVIAAALVSTCVATFAQGNFLFSGPSKGVWDDFSVAGVSKLASADIDVTFLFAAGSVTPNIDSDISTSTTTNQTQNSFNDTTAWNDILNGQFTIATNNGAVAVATTSASPVNGSWNYNSSTSFSDTAASGGTAYTVYVIAWSSAYATPQAAAAANSPVGWSLPFSYTPTSGITGAPTMSTSITPFGVVATPEPTTIALAGMGVASLLAFRRRK